MLIQQFCFACFSRSRWSDIKYLDQLWFERGEFEGEVFGIVEDRTQHHKSATSSGKKQRFTPLVCPLLGIGSCLYELGIVLETKPFGPPCRAAASGGSV